MILQDSFYVFEPKSLIRKGRERHIFLFELYLLFSKEVKDSNGKAKYIYKNKLLVCYSFCYFFYQVLLHIFFKILNLIYNIIKKIRADINPFILH